MLMLLGFSVCAAAAGATAAPGAAVCAGGRVCAACTGWSAGDVTGGKGASDTAGCAGTGSGVICELARAPVTDAPPPGFGSIERRPKENHKVRPSTTTASAAMAPNEYLLGRGERLGLMSIGAANTGAANFRADPYGWDDVLMQRIAAASHRSA